MVELPIKLKTNFNNGFCNWETLEDIRKWLRDEEHLYVGTDVRMVAGEEVYRYVILDMTSSKAMKKPQKSEETFGKYEDAICAAIKVVANYHIEE